MNPDNIPQLSGHPAQVHVSTVKPSEAPSTDVTEDRDALSFPP